METKAPDHASKRCVKCLAAMPEPDWVVNKDMAYCKDCAALLHLGESKESRMFNDMQDRPVGHSENGVPGPIAVPAPQDLESGEPDPSAPA